MVTKYSNFVSFPLYLNGKRMNTLQVRPSAAWRARAAMGASWYTLGLDGQRLGDQNPSTRCSLWRGEVREADTPPHSAPCTSCNAHTARCSFTGCRAVALVCSELCSPHLSQCWNLFIPPEAPLYPSAATPQAPAPRLWQPQSALSLSGFTCSGHFFFSFLCF